MIRKKTFFKNRIMVFPFVLLVGGLLLLSNDMGIIRWYQLRHERNETQVEIDRLIQKEVKLTIEQPSRIDCEVDLENMPATALSLAGVGLLSISAECIFVHEVGELYRHDPAPGH